MELGTPNITLITPTGGRGEAFSLCEKWISNQTLHPTEWRVTDDCPIKRTLLTRGQTLVPHTIDWTPDINTQRFNMMSLLEDIKGDYIFIIEDDEYYSPEYLEVMCKYLEYADIVGLSNSKYYHLKGPGFKYMGNFSHASLCHTAIRKSVLPLLLKAVHSGHYYFDIELWKYVHEQKLVSVLLADTNLAVGIKGMPGRYGLGTGHDLVGYRADNDYVKIEEWLGEDWESYRDYLK